MLSRMRLAKPNHEWMDGQSDLMEVYEEWVEAMKELQAANRERSPRVAALSQRAHIAFESYLRAIEREARKIAISVHEEDTGTDPTVRR